MIDLKAKLWRWHVDASGAALCVVATLVFYLLGISPLVREHDSIEAHQASLAAQQSIALELVEKLQIEQDNLDQAKKTLQESPFELVSSAGVNHRIARMAELASNCGLKLNQIRPGSPTVGSRYETIPIRMTGMGNYRTCVMLLYRLRQSFPDTTVTSLELSRDVSDPHAGGTFNVQLLWYASPAMQASR